MGFCCLLLVVALLLNAKVTHITNDPASQISASLLRLADLLDGLADGGDDKAAGKELYDLARSFHRKGYDRRHLLHLPDRQKRCYHLLALLFQRASYLVTDGPSWQAALDGVAAALEERICPLTDLNGVPVETLPQGELCYVVRRYMENAQALLTA